MSHQLDFLSPNRQVCQNSCTGIGLDQFLISPACGQQFLMSASFHDLGPVEDQDAVGLEDGVEAVGDGQDGFASHQLSGGVRQLGFCDRVKLGGGFIQQQDRGILEECPGQGEALCLPAGKAGPTFADQGLRSLPGGTR